MPDLDDLHAAFRELERRADTAPTAASSPPPRNTRWPLVAASAVVVLAVAGGTVALVDSGNGPAPAAGPGPDTPSVSAPVSSPVSTPTSEPPSTATPSGRQPVRRLPSSGNELAARLQEVLGATGKVVSYQVYGDTYVVGRLHTDRGEGSFDLQTVPDAGGSAQCEDPGRMTCVVRTLPDGATYAFGREESQTQSGGILYLVNLVRTDGTGFLFHVSNEGDPKGAGGVLGDAPPLTRQQMLTILRSDLWGR